MPNFIKLAVLAGIVAFAGACAQQEEEVVVPMVMEDDAPMAKM